MIIDSYSKTDNKGLPMGNQTSQWFALYYLDSFDRLAKEKLHFKYSNAGEMKKRAMRDFVLVPGNPAR